MKGHHEPRPSRRVCPARLDGWRLAGVSGATLRTGPAHLINVNRKKNQFFTLSRHGTTEYSALLALLCA